MKTKTKILCFLKPWDHSKVVDLELLIRPVSLRAHETSKTPHSLQNNVSKSKQMVPGTQGPRDQGPGTSDCVECVSGVCQPCVRCVSAIPKAKIRGQPQTQNPRPARNQGGTHPPCHLFAKNGAGHTFAMMRRTRSLCHPVSRG